jgi:2-(1,2-epoxy-1,2-dihydrophenyl)acetyl-CoA isomerase
VICAVNGAVAGGGLSFLFASDLVLAAERAVFRYGYSGVGLYPDGSSTYFLPRLLGMHRGHCSFALTDRSLTAEEARGWALVSRVLAGDELAEAAADLKRFALAAPSNAPTGQTYLVRP